MKNLVSERRVPVHSHLIELGLIAFLGTAKGQASRLLLVRPKRKSGHGTGRATVGDAVSKWWALLLKHCKMEGRKNLHSFRHTVVTRLTAAGVSQDMREMLVGHASNTVHGQVYVHRDKMLLTMLKEHLEKLDFRVALH